MFDFFCCYNSNRIEDSELQNPFLNVEAYKLLEFTTEYLSFDNLEIFTLNRNKVDWQNYYSGSRFTVLIYGYLFLLDIDKVTILKRFTAKDLNDWLLNGKNIDMQNFKGAYSIFIFDQKSNIISVITDPLNIRYILYCEFKGSYLFSTSLDAIIEFMKHHGVEPEINWISYFQHYLLDFILNEETFIEGIHLVPPAHYLTLSQTGLRLEKYWDILQELRIEKPLYSSYESVELINNYLKKHVKNYIDNPGKSAIALTGGYDSRTLTALLGKKAFSYSFFSYGYGKSWDLSIPKKMAQNLGLHFESYILNGNFEELFETNVTLALSLSNGTALFTQANIPFIYQKYSKDKSSILTGLFGSELIKYPTSRGLFVDENMIEILFSEDPKSSIEELISGIPLELSEKLRDNKFKEELMSSILNHPYIVNKFIPAKKFFLYLTMVGARKYFAKEIAMERPFVDNLHPFWDVGLMSLLIKTPYTWLHYFDKGSRFLTNLKLHQLYAKLIFKNNQRMAWFMSSHATRPIFLTQFIFLPLIIIDYLKYRKRIKKETVLYPENIHDRYINMSLKRDKKLFPEITNLFSNKIIRKKEYYKIISFTQWRLLSNKLVHK